MAGIPAQAREAARASIAESGRRLGIVGIDAAALAEQAVDAAAPHISAQLEHDHNADRHQVALEHAQQLADAQARLTAVRSQVQILRQNVDEQAARTNAVIDQLAAAKARGDAYRCVLERIQTLPYTGEEPASRRLARDVLRAQP